MTSEVPSQVIRIWEDAVGRLRKIARRIGQGPVNQRERDELLAALTAVDDACEEHIIAVRVWAGRT